MRRSALQIKCGEYYYVLLRALSPLWRLEPVLAIEHFGSCLLRIKMTSLAWQ
jgi:hypothetical protein